MNDMLWAQLGKETTFTMTGNMYYLLGIAFGCSYAMPQIDIIAWEITPPSYKFIRCLFGVAPCLIFLGVSIYQENKDVGESDYVFLIALPKLIVGFFTHGVMVIACVKLGFITKAGDRSHTRTSSRILSTTSNAN
jgi:hypothetical protein